ncbi:MAG TPA: stage II sporulation protein M [Candidatus Binatus sp.]|nr:stage II sporulation protein M [Candidatus Binatus sp.]
MVGMPKEELRIYCNRLRPFLVASVATFAVGAIIGLMLVNHFPQLTESFEESLNTFITGFRGLPKTKLAAAIFLNNSIKTLIVIVFGALVGVIPAVFLVVNGAALGAVMALSAHSRGLWVSLLSVAPHGVLELPAVFLGTAIGLMIGKGVLQRIFSKSEITLRAELGRAFRFFTLIIVPILFIAAIVEAYVTAALVGR